MSTLDPATAHMLSASLSRLRHRAPFFATLAMFARYESSEKIPTAATDGRTVFINPNFFNPLSPAEQDGLLLHEVLHAALLHIPRRNARDKQRWNIAADIVINGMILKQGMQLPKGGMVNHDMENFSSEEVYELLERSAEPQPSLQFGDLLEGEPGEGEGDGQGKDGEGPLGQDRSAQLEGHWRNAMQQARVVEQSFMPGAMPAGLERELRNLDAAQLDWRSYLWRYLVRTPTDFADFDRRFVGRGLYLETLSGENVRVAVAVDTSGSIANAQIQTFVSEVQGILQAYPHLRCDLYYADAELHGPFELAPSGPIPTPIGGGGTDFKPFFARVGDDQDPLAPNVCIYLTDGYGDFPALPPTIPTLWVVTPGGLDTEQFPFGEAVRLLK